MGLHHGLLNQKFRQLGVELWPEDMQGVHALLEQAGGHHHIGVDGPVRNAQTARQYLPPALRLAAGILVADNHGRVYFRQQRLQRIVGRPAYDKADLPLLQILFDVRQALIEEGIVAQVGVGKIGDGGEVDQYRKIQGVGNFHRNVEGRIIERSLCSLHPVDDAFSIRRRSPAAPDQNPGIGGDFAQRLGDFIVVFGGHWEIYCREKEYVLAVDRLRF